MTLRVGRLSGDKNGRARLVINLENGIYYGCAKEAADIYDINYSTMRSRLNGKVRKKTSFIYA